MIYWNQLIKSFITSQRGQKLSDFLQEERDNHKVWPRKSDIFSGLNDDTCNYFDVKIVIVGQDPYPSSHAHGPAFSSLQSETPFSLARIKENIYHDLYPHLDIESFKMMFKSNDLRPWIKKGILLINSVWTVREGEPGSHEDKGWEVFTQIIIEELSKRELPMVFVLMGSKAQAYKNLITGNHYVMGVPHPAKERYQKGCFVNKPFFSQAFKFLRENKIENEKLFIDTKEFVQVEKLINKIKTQLKENGFPVEDQIMNFDNALENFINNDYGWEATRTIDLRLNT